MRLRTRRILAAVTVVTASLTAIATTGFTDDVTHTRQSAQRLNPPAQRATFAFTGDVITHRPVNYAAQQPDGSYDYSGLFAHVAPLLDWADVAVCHLEQPVAPPGQPVIVGPKIHASAASIGAGLAAGGFDRCSTASNHSVDYGVAGIDATVGALLGAGVAQSGMARSAAEAVPQLFDVGGITTAHLAYSYALGGPRPSGQPWRANLIDTNAIVAAASDARVRGAEAVILSLHWGSAAQSAPSSYQRQVAHAVTASGDIDLIVGHHSHVVQPIEQVNGTWVAWGLGNFLSTMPVPGYWWPDKTQDGVIVTVSMVRASNGSVVVERPLAYPTWVDKNNGHVIRPTSHAADASLSATVRWQLGVSEARTRSVIGAFFGPA